MFGGQVLVLHLPGVVERVIGRVADEERQRPRPHALAFAGVVGAHRLDVRRPVVAQPVGGERRVLLDPEADLLREVLALDADGVADDPVAIASATARPLRSPGDPRGDSVEERPAGLEQHDPALERRVAHRILLGRGWGEGDAQKSVEPVPTLSSTMSSGPAASNSLAIPARLAIGRYRAR